MRNTFRLVPMLMRALGIALVAVASLQLSLRTAEALFVHRQGGESDALLPIAAWFGVVALGLALYGRGAARRPAPSSSPRRSSPSRP